MQVHGAYRPERTPDVQPERDVGVPVEGEGADYHAAVADMRGKVPAGHQLAYIVTERLSSAEG